MSDFVHLIHVQFDYDKSGTVCGYKNRGGFSVRPKDIHYYLANGQIGDEHITTIYLRDGSTISVLGAHADVREIIEGPTPDPMVKKPIPEA